MQSWVEMSGGIAGGIFSALLHATCEVFFLEGNGKGLSSKEQLRGMLRFHKILGRDNSFLILEDGTLSY